MDRCQGLADLGLDARRVDPDQAAQVGDRAVLDEVIGGDSDDLEDHLAEGRVDGPRLLEQLQDAAAEAARDHALFEGDDEALAADLLEDQLPVERLGPALLVR